MTQTAVIWHPTYLAHETGLLHPERPERLTAIKKVLDERPIGKKLIRLEPRVATPEEVSLIHDFEYVRKIQATAGHDRQLDPDTAVSPRSWEAACLAVGGMLTAVDWVLGEKGLPASSPSEPAVRSSQVPTTARLRSRPADHHRAAVQRDSESFLGDLAGSPFSRNAGSPLRVRNAFAFVRPPGHHAERARAMGFCLFNNVAIAAEYALRKPGVKKVLIVDYDVHHGNGTQGAFYDRDDVFYISTHRYPFYPGTGARREEGTGKGRGFTLNVPFSGGQGDEEYLKSFDDEIIPAARDYHPDLILVSAGYDAHRQDPLGGMNVTANGFGEMTRRILEVADQSCDGRVVAVLEGGYSLEGLAQSAEACLEAMGR